MPEKGILKKIICNRNYCRNKNIKNKIKNGKRVIFFDEIIQENELKETIKNDINELIKQMNIN